MKKQIEERHIRAYKELKKQEVVIYRLKLEQEMVIFTQQIVLNKWKLEESIAYEIYLNNKNK